MTWAYELMIAYLSIMGVLVLAALVMTVSYNIYKLHRRGKKR